MHAKRLLVFEAPMSLIIRVSIKMKSNQNVVNGGWRPRYFWQNCRRTSYKILQYTKVVWLVSLLRHKALSQTSRAHYCYITKLMTIESNCTNKCPHLTYDNVNEFTFINVHLQTVLIGYFDILQIWQGSLESTFLFQIIYIFCCL